ncbi:MAG: hypothetical protein PHQ23_16895 [Candidatus Wallbacteria bacterium]|nr:hypothetical protein [Candidatus Wallbacteria bacterium]
MYTKIVFILIALTLIEFFPLQAFAGEALDLENNVCPVMGGKSNPALKVELDGVIYRVCCGGCIGMLKKETDRYLKGFAYEKGGVQIATKE